MDGEGHFLALFRKKGDSLPPVFRFSAKGPDKNTRKWLEEFFSEIGLKTIGGQEFDWNRVEVRKDKVYYQLPFPLDLRGISFLRNGLYLGDLKKNRFEPLSLWRWLFTKEMWKQLSPCRFPTSGLPVI